MIRPQFFFRGILLIMCLSKYSNLELLNQVAMNLYSSKDHDFKELCEIELAALINTFYQVRFIFDHQTICYDKIDY